ncbi:Ribosome biogenesis protein WDR12 [Blattella germanica]|nr:Ribosome biogenesis protein WDR12 [Blattella germanica]
MAEQLEVRLVTKQQKFAVPDAPFSVPASVTCSELNSLVNELRKGIGEFEQVDFDFLVCGEVLRVPLTEHLQERSVSSEVTVEIEYFERVPAPEPHDCLLHDDWVSAVQVQDDWILSGCYDNTLHLWTTKGTHRLTIPGHAGPIKAVAWVSHDNAMATFVSASHDQTAMLWEWNVSTNAVECVHVCRGHERGLECVGVSPCNSRMATGGWDTRLKIWSAEIHETTDAGGETLPKRMKTEHGKSQVRTPLMTLKGHKEAISSVQWTDASEICTASWDHTLRIWDTEIGGIKSEVVGNKSFFDASWSPLNRTLITASADRHIRLYDPRSKEGALVKSMFTSHSKWVQCVKWSAKDEHLFISGSHDQQVKLWDSRSTRAPLFDLKGHEGKVLCCDWSNPELMVSGGSDNTLRIFQSNQSR